jgi:hypothetical protein
MHSHFAAAHPLREEWLQQHVDTTELRMRRTYLNPAPPPRIPTRRTSQSEAETRAGDTASRRGSIGDASMKSEEHAPVYLPSLCAAEPEDASSICDTKVSKLD